MSILSAQFLEELSSCLSQSIITQESERAAHVSGLTYHHAMIPDVIVYPISTEEVSKTMICCYKHQVPVIPYGAGTSVEGHTSAVQGGICMDLSRMNQIKDIDPVNFCVTVQAGVRRKALDEALQNSGFFFPAGPGVNATIGGMAATRASGIYSVRYGTMKQNVLSMTVVLPDGKIIKTSNNVKKSSAGYDLTSLFIGAEGTLGIITELTVKLFPLPSTISMAAVSFPSFESAVAASIQVITKGILVASIELLDEITIEAVNHYSSLDYPVMPVIFFEFHGQGEEIQSHIQQVEKIVTPLGGTHIRWAANEAERIRLAKARTDALPAVMELKPGSKIIGTDVCVPVSELATCILATKLDIAKSGLIAPLFGHVGDGNFHLAILVDPNAADEMQKAKTLNESMLTRAITMGGTCTGEHGIGIGKIPFMYMEHGNAVDVMRLIKQAMDPKNIMNPGKILPE